MPVPARAPDYSLVIPPVGDYPAETLVDVGGGLQYRNFLPMSVGENEHGRYIKLTQSLNNAGALSLAGGSPPVLPLAEQVTIRLWATPLTTAGITQTTTNFVARAQHLPFSAEEGAALASEIRLDRNANFNQWNYQHRYGRTLLDQQYSQANSNTRFLEAVYQLRRNELTLYRGIPLGGGIVPLPSTYELDAWNINGATPSIIQALHPQYVVYAFDVWNDFESTGAGMWATRQRQALAGNAGGWPLRQRQNGSATGTWPLRQRQNGL